jgi:hypothetical protein
VVQPQENALNPYDYKYNTPLTDAIERVLETRGFSNPLTVLLRLEEEAEREMVAEGDLPVTPAKVKQRVTDALLLW